MPQNKKYYPTQSGNVFVLILIGVFLFGALMFTFSRSGEQGSGKLTKQQTKIAAQEIINYGRSLEDAVNRVRRKGCSESQISFDDAALTGYENTNAPDDNSCHIFHTAGGKVTYQNDPLNINQSGFGQYIFSARTRILGIGSDCPEASCVDLYLFLRTTLKSVCTQYNELLGIDNPAGDAPIEVGLSASSKYTGIITATSNVLGDDNDGANFVGKSSGCYKDSSETFGGQPYYDFYHVLLAR